MKIAQLIADEADRELYDPAIVRRRLEDAAEARAAGLITDDDFELVQRQAAAAALHTRKG